MNTVTVNISIELPLGKGKTSVRISQHELEATPEDERIIAEVIALLMADPAEFKRIHLAAQAA